MTVVNSRDLAEMCGVAPPTVKFWEEESGVVLPWRTNPRGTVGVMDYETATRIVEVYEQHGLDGLKAGLHLSGGSRLTVSVMPSPTPDIFS